MLPRENRLISQKDFNLIYRFGQSFSFGGVFLKIRENGLKKTRIGFSVGVKFSSKATERNKIRRQLREIAKKLEKQIKKKVDMVVMIKKTAKNPKAVSLENDFRKALEKAKIIKLN